MIIGNRVTNPGELRTPVRLLGATTIVTDAGGAQRPSRTELGTVLAKWIGVHGNEVWASQAMKAEKLATVTIRYRADVDETCTVELDGEEYEIISIDDIEKRHEWIEMKVKFPKGTV